MSDWKTAIPAKILERGIDYYDAGSVTSLTKLANGWRATVAGSTDYTVFVPATMDPRRAQCNCPYFAGGKVCKHIVAAFKAVEDGYVPGDAPKESKPAPETIESIVSRIDASELRAFVVEAAKNDERFERRLRGSFGVADLKKAKRELQKATTEIKRSYESGGFIDWRASGGFANEYLPAVEAIVAPFFKLKDADSLIDLAIARFVQLQRIAIDDSDGFFSDAMADIMEHLDKTFALANVAQRRRLLKTLTSFMDKNPGRDRGSIYWYEKDQAEDFICVRYSPEADFAESILALADRQLLIYPQLSGSDTYKTHFERARWGEARLKAMAAVGSSANKLRAFAEACGLLSSAGVVRLLAEAYLNEGAPLEAKELLQESLGAIDNAHYSYLTGRPPRLVDMLIEVTSEHCTESELADLYFKLLCRGPERRYDYSDARTWYDALRGLMGEKEWLAAREALLNRAPYETMNACLAHEGSYDELYCRIMSHGGKDLMTYESELSGLYPQPFIERYLEYALRDMEHAYDRRSYQRVAKNLSHAGEFEGGWDRAQEVASAIREKYPRKTALAEELRYAGFDV